MNGQTTRRQLLNSRTSRLDGDDMVKQDEHGRFVKGHTGGPGRPKRKTEEAYFDAFRKYVKPEDWKAIIEKAITDAKDGDTAARKFLADYLIGPPIERKEISGADGSPLKVIVEYVNDTPETAETA